MPTPNSSPLIPNLPNTTVFGKRIPKQKFYENIDVSPALKRVFVEQIKIIYWRNKIAPSTVNLAAGETVTEIEVFEIKLTSQMQPEPVLRQIDKAIPYHIVFLLEYEGKYQAWTAYKEVSAGVNAFKVHSYYHTDWLLEEDVPLKIEGQTTDAVYENFVRQISGLKQEEGKTLDEQIAIEEKRNKLQKEIEKLEKLARAEKQPKKKFEYVQRLKQLSQEQKK